MNVFKLSLKILFIILVLYSIKLLSIRSLTSWIWILLERQLSIQWSLRLAILLWSWLVKVLRGIYLWEHLCISIAWTNCPSLSLCLLYSWWFFLFIYRLNINHNWLILTTDYLWFLARIIETRTWISPFLK